MSQFYDFQLTKLGGGELNLGEFKGKALLLVNVASKCGLTPQYEGLEALYQNYQEQGLEILGLPCNQFMGQEPGSDQEIQQFCSTKYRVTFPMSSKIDVNGDNRDPLYEYLAGESAEFPGDIQWNFEKFLVDQNGKVQKRFSPKVEPNDPDLISAIEALL